MLKMLKATWRGLLKIQVLPIFGCQPERQATVMRYKIVNPSTETDESVDNARGKGTYNNGNDFCIIYSMIITKKETVFECQPTVGRQLMLLFITIRMFWGL